MERPRQATMVVAAMHNQPRAEQWRKGKLSLWQLPSIGEFVVAVLFHLDDHRIGGEARDDGFEIRQRKCMSRRPVLPGVGHE